MAGASCPVCGTPGPRSLVSVPRVPVFCNQLCRTRRAAIEAPTGPIDLRFCDRCGHAFNAAFDPAAIEYGPEYENSLHCSATFREYAERLADLLVSRHDLRGKLVFEIGCGQGDFLRLLCARGQSRGFGLDPSYAGDGVARAAPAVRIIAAPYSPDALREQAPDLVCSRHVLEHIAEPIPFLRAVRESCARPEGTPVFFEVPNALYTLRSGGIWDLVYEHVGYFTPPSLERAFLEAGFAVDAVETTFAGQFLTIHARAFPSRPDRIVPGDPAALEAIRADAHAFADLHRTTVRRWSGRLRSFAQAGTKVAVWGAGSKGSTFVNLVGSTDLVSSLVDVNPRKQGAFVAGSGHAIVSPERLGDDPPGAVVVMNSVYREEIAAQLRGLGMSPTLLAAA